MKRPNVLLIVMDCVRFDELSVYGHSQPTTPHLDALAADGVVFDNAFAAAPWTPPSHASLFTGNHPSTHGVDVGENLHLSEENRVLAEVLAQAGYRTFGLLPDVHLSQVRGFDKGFHETLELWKIRYHYPELAWLECMAWNALWGRDKRTRYTNKVLKKWIRRSSSSEAPFFVFVNYKTAHARYTAPRPYHTRFEANGSGIDLEKVRRFAHRGGYSYMGGGMEMTENELRLARSWYTGSIAYLDHRIGELIGYLKAVGVYDDTLVIVTADHGENFGEHHLAYHLFCLYDTLLHVPLLMSCPARLPRGRRVPGLASLVDVMPTILEVAEIDDRPSMQGRSLAPFDDRSGADCVFAEFGRPHYMLERLEKSFPGHDFSRFDRGLQAVRTAQHKLIVGSDGSEELYALERDPGETANRIDDLSSVAIDLRERLQTWRDSMAPTLRGKNVDEDETVTKALRDLGYF